MSAPSFEVLWTAMRKAVDVGLIPAESFPPAYLVAVDRMSSILTAALTAHDAEAARVIEAAPEMLAALKLWANAEQCRTYIPDREKPDWDEIMAATRAAIAKAAPADGGRP